MNDLSEIARVIGDSQNILIIAHIQPDGDTLGSCFALERVLSKKGKSTIIYCDDGIPGRYKELFPSDAVTTSVNSGTVFDLAIAIDCADKARIGKANKVFKNAVCSINIDHHITNEQFAKMNFISDASSTGEIIFELMREMGAEQDELTSKYLYIAISTDTGNFTYSNTSGKCLSYVSELVDLFNLRETADILFRRRSLVLTRLIARALTRIEIFNEGKVAAVTLLSSDMKELGASGSDCENIVDFAREIEETKVAVFFREIKNGVKISFRSKGDIDISEVASAFGGGGHKNAAGCCVNEKMDEVKPKILDMIGKLV